MKYNLYCKNRKVLVVHEYKYIKGQCYIVCDLILKNDENLRVIRPIDWFTIIKED